MDRRKKINAILSHFKGAPVQGSIPVSWWINNSRKVAEKLKLVIIKKGNDYFVDNEKVDIEKVQAISETIIILPDNDR